MAKIPSVRISREELADIAAKDKDQHARGKLYQLTYKRSNREPYIVVGTYSTRWQAWAAIAMEDVDYQMAQILEAGLDPNAPDVNS